VTLGSPPPGYERLVLRNACCERPQRVLGSERGDIGRVPGDDEVHSEHEGLRECRAAWLVGVSLQEYRELEAGDRTPSLGAFEGISELYGWPQTFVPVLRALV